MSCLCLHLCHVAEETPEHRAVAQAEGSALTLVVGPQKLPLTSYNIPKHHQQAHKEHRKAVQSSVPPVFPHRHPQMFLLCPYLCSSGPYHLSCSAVRVNRSPFYSTKRTHPFKLYHLMQSLIYRPTWIWGIKI